MGNFILLGILLLLTVSSLLLERYRKKTLKKSLQSYFDDNNLLFDSSLPILYIHYSSAQLKAMDEILKIDKAKSVYVVFEAPSWLFETKKKQWQAILINANDISNKTPINLHQEKAFLLDQSSYITEIIAYFDQYLIRKEVS